MTISLKNSHAETVVLARWWEIPTLVLVAHRTKGNIAKFTKVRAAAVILLKVLLEHERTQSIPLFLKTTLQNLALWNATQLPSSSPATRIICQ